MSQLQLEDVFKCCEWVLLPPGRGIGLCLTRRSSSSLVSCSEVVGRRSRRWTDGLEPCCDLSGPEPKRELKICQCIYVLTHNFDYEMKIMTKRTRPRIHAVEICFRCRMSAKVLKQSTFWSLKWRELPGRRRSLHFSSRYSRPLTSLPFE